MLIDDHEFVRLGLRSVFHQTPDLRVVCEGGSIREAVELAVQHRPDVVLLDVQLPDGSGFNACKQIRASLPNAKIIVLTAFADDQVIFGAITAGADGYLLKDINPETLLQSIRTVAGGKSILDPAITAQVMRRIKQGSGALPSNKLDLLSAQERRVIALVAEGKTNKEIGLALQLSDKTVKNYLSNAFEKLHLTRRSQAAALFAKQSI